MTSINAELNSVQMKYEFQCTKYREKVLGWMELFWTAGIITLPLAAWLIIPMHLNYYNNYIFFDSWKLFVLVCSLSAVFLGLWLLWFPESPKSLLDCGEYDQALEILRRMFTLNTGHDSLTYPVSRRTVSKQFLLYFGIIQYF